MKKLKISSKDHRRQDSVLISKSFNASLLSGLD